MRRLAVLSFFLICSCSNPVAGQSALDFLKQTVQGESDLSDSEVQGGLREALTVGMQRVIDQVGVDDGFNLDPEIHIPLPGSLQKVDKALSRIGLNSLTDNLETRLNRAAEAAAPEAKALFIDTISGMTLEDAQNILTGPDDAATQFFREKTSDRLTELMRPVVESSLQEVGALQAMDTAVSRYKNLPFVPDVSADLTSYTIDKSMDGIFYYLAKEEAAIRQDPIKRSTALLRKVFGSN